MANRQAVFAAGCFWGIEKAFRERDGVVDAEVGYTGGGTEDPGYEEVCRGTTGHAEAVRVAYDPDEVSYEALLELFFSIHDPTQVDRQGPDVGRQYRSALFPVDREQEAAARATIRELDASGRFDRPVATRIEPAGPFWRAEEHHQRYLEKRKRLSGRLLG